MLRDREYAPHIASNDPAQVCRSLVDASNAAGAQTISQWFVCSFLKLRE
jgi:hypothetical protein